MLWLLFILAMSIILAISPVWFPRLLIKLGDYDEWWSPLRTKPPEGEMYVMGIATEDGPFFGVLESVAGYSYDSVNHIFVKDTSKTSQDDCLTRNGLVYVGFNKYIIQRTIRYDKWVKMDKSTKWGLEERIRTGPSIYFQYLMATKVDQVETRGNFPVSAVVSFTVQIFSPRLALFFAGGWESRVNAEVQALLRHYIGTKNIDELRKEKELNSGGLVTALMTPTNSTSPNINNELEKIGVRIIAATFVDYDLEAADADANKAVRATELARQLGDAKIVEAEKDRDAKKIKAEAINIEYRARRDAGGPDAGTFRVAEAIEEAGKSGVKAFGALPLVDVSK